MTTKRVVYVWLPDEEVHGVVLQENPHWCRVRFTKNGIEHIEIISQEDIVFLKEVEFTDNEGAGE
jgi:hypothetical protein